MDDNLRREVLAYLRSHHTMMVATVEGEQPWAAGVFFVHSSNLSLYFLSEAGTRHSRELEGNPRVAVTIHEDYDDWRKIKGIQLQGKAQRVVSRRERARALSLYLAKFPFVKDFIPSPLALLSSLVISGKAMSVEVYRVTPERLFYLDNAKGFSHREELLLG